MKTILFAQIADDPNKLIGIAHTISEQSLASIIVLLVALCLGGMGYMLKVFLAKIDKKDAIIQDTLKQYSQDAAKLTGMESAINANTVAMRENTTVMQRFRDKLPAVMAGAFLSIALLVGCAGPGGGSGWTVERFAVLAKSVATETSIIHLEEKPQHRQTIELVVEQLNLSIAAGLYTPARLRAILKPLGIRELASKEGRIAVAGTIVIYDMVIGSTDIAGDPTKLRPLFEGIRDGFQTALDLTK